MVSVTLLEGNNNSTQMGEERHLQSYNLFLTFKRLNIVDLGLGLVLLSCGHKE